MSLQVVALAAAAVVAGGPVGPSIAHGGAIATQRCAACHAVGEVGASPNGGAPPFRRINLRYNPLSLGQALKRIALKGHYEMPPQSLSDSDLEDLSAYIQTLEAPGR